MNLNENQKGLVPIVIILITAIVSFAAAGGGVWWWQDQQIKKQETENKKQIDDLKKQLEDSKKEVEELKKSSESDSSESSDNDVSDWKIYKNTKYGFQMTFPESWKGYRLFEVTTSWGSNGTATTFYISLPTTSKTWKEDGISSGYASVFAMSIFSHSQWDKISVEEGPKPTYINKNSQNVFAYGYAQDSPEDLIGKAGDVKNIISTFKFTK